MSNRRAFLLNAAAIGAGVAVAGLAGCANNPLNGPAKIDITTAQMWAKEVTAAADSFAAQAQTELGAQITPAIAAQIQTAVQTLNAANTAFQGLASGATTVNGLVQSIVSMLQSLMALLGPIYPAIASVMPEVDVAVMVLTAFLNNVAIVVPPVPAAIHKAAMAHG